MSDPEPVKPNPFTERLAPIVGAAILLVFFAVLIFMFVNLENDDWPWERAVFLFGAVEGLAFAAAGFFFGKEVNRQRAESAEERADDAGEKANQESARAAQAEADGKSLAGAVLQASRNASRGGGPRIAGGGLESLDSSDLAAQDAELRTLRATARRLFPDVEAPG